jgi:divalent metal cation (Fe/Co/Zn/Cd) transporter
VTEKEDNSSSNNLDKEEKKIFNKKQDLAFLEKKRIVITSIIASACLALLKLVIGLSTNSLGILSESFHSGLDMLAALMTLYAIRM